MYMSLIAIYYLSDNIANGALFDVFADSMLHRAYCCFSHCQQKFTKFYNTDEADAHEETHQAADGREDVLWLVFRVLCDVRHVHTAVV